MEAVIDGTVIVCGHLAYDDGAFGHEAAAKSARIRVAAVMRHQRSSKGEAIIAMGA
jgi:hypothetical protein